MQVGRTTLSTVLACALVACGGGGSGGNPPPTGGTPTPSPTPPPTNTACSLSARQDFALAVLDEWYLFPNLLDKTVNKANYSDVQSYIDALVAPARAQAKDRYFTYITSIEEEERFFREGSSAGFGFRLGYDTSANRVFVIEVFESAPAFSAGFDRGDELVAIGTSTSNLQLVSDIMAAQGPSGVISALGASTTGTTRVIRFREPSGTERTVTISKSEYNIDPVSDRYGTKILDDGGKKVGYVNLRTFIDSAAPDLRAAFGQFRSQGISEVIIDVRYNGGGLVSIAELMGDLMGRDKVGKVFSYTTLRESKSERNTTELFGTEANAIAPTKLAFIGTGSTASASELITNAMIPYLGNSMALVGSNTYGKPVGQYGFDKEECDDRLRAVTFKVENANRQGEYFRGLASVVPQTCAAPDDIRYQLGDPQESSVRAALDFLAGRSCSAIPISSAGTTTQSIGSGRAILQPRNPTAAQRETPGLF